MPNLIGTQSFNVRRGGWIWYFDAASLGIDDGFVVGVVVDDDGDGDGCDAAAADELCLLCWYDDK